MSRVHAIVRRRWGSHLVLWLTLVVVTPPGLWAYAAAGLELDLALLLSFCSSVAR